MKLKNRTSYNYLLTTLEKNFNSAKEVFDYIKESEDDKMKLAFERGYSSYITKYANSQIYIAYLRKIKPYITKKEIAMYIKRYRDIYRGVSDFEELERAKKLSGENDEY